MENNSIFNLLFRTTIAFILLLLLTRLLGKKQLSQLTFFNYVTGITIGSLSANIIVTSKNIFSELFLSLIWWYILTGLSGILGLKFECIRKVIDGEPIIIINRGKLVMKALKKIKLNIQDLTMLLREQNIFSITDVEYAILETDGKLSIMKKQEKQEITKQDMKISLDENKTIPSEIIADGNIIKKNLKGFNLDEQWLSTQLSLQNIKSTKEVMYAEIQSDGKLYLQKY